ncbi:MAG: ribosome-associated translation inhibitor RaiA [Nevskia sp.]|nr:ribosome-associated translation inhibitor RaiA [Nevskia sp.]
MQLPLEIDYRNVQSSAAIDEAVRKRVTRLQRMSPRLVGCHVVLEAPHHHHHQGNAYQVHVRLTVPGAEIAVNRGHKPHEDLYVAIGDAFDAAERQLETRMNKAREEARHDGSHAP